MSETQQPSTTKSKQTQVFQHEEDELSLLDILEVILNKKVRIVLITLIFTILALIYTSIIPPIYRSTIGFLPPDDISLSSYFPESISEVLPGKAMFNKDGILIKNNKSLFYKFLTNIQSYQLQKKVLLEGSFYNKFLNGNPDKSAEDAIALGINQSIHMIDDKSETSKKTFDKSIYFKMDGKKPQVISDFLNTLAKAAKELTIINAKKNIQRVIDAQIEKKSTLLEEFYIKNREERHSKITLFTHNLEIAKKLGVKKHNFVKPIESSFTVVLKRTPAVIQPLPLWYLYGERALQEELNVLKNKGKTSGKHILEISELKFELANLKRLDISKINFETAIISQPSIPNPTPINNNKTKITLIGVFSGLFLGLASAFFSKSLDALRERSLSKSS